MVGVFLLAKLSTVRLLLHLLAGTPDKPRTRWYSSAYPQQPGCGPPEMRFLSSAMCHGGQSNGSEAGATLPLPQQLRPPTPRPLCGNDLDFVG